MVAKAGLGLVGLGAIGIGGVAFAKPEWLGLNKEISWTPLSADHDFSSQSNTYQNTKFGGKYKDYLVGVVGNEKDKHLNKGMWEKLFKRWGGSKPNSGKFSSTVIDGAYSEAPQTETKKALNRVCEDAYKTEINSFGNVDTQFTKADVWKYCSPGPLVHLEKDGYENQNIGGGSEKTTLVSVKEDSNNWFWEQRNKDFWEGTGTWSGSSGTESDDSNKSSFRKEFDKKDATESDHSKRQTVKQLCEQAYKTATSNEKELTDAKKFCKLETDS